MIERRSFVQSFVATLATIAVVGSTSAKTEIQRAQAFAKKREFRVCHNEDEPINLAKGDSIAINNTVDAQRNCRFIGIEYIFEEE